MGPEGFPQAPLPSGSSAGAARNRQDAELSPAQWRCTAQPHSTDAQLHPWFQGVGEVKKKKANQLYLFNSSLSQRQTYVDTCWLLQKEDKLSHPDCGLGLENWKCPAKERPLWEAHRLRDSIRISPWSPPPDHSFKPLVLPYLLLLQEGAADSRPSEDGMLLLCHHGSLGFKLDPVIRKRCRSPSVMGDLGPGQLLTLFSPQHIPLWFLPDFESYKAESRQGEESHTSSLDGGGWLSLSETRQTTSADTARPV